MVHKGFSLGAPSEATYCFSFDGVVEMFGGKPAEDVPPV